MTGGTFGIMNGKDKASLSDIRSMRLCEKTAGVSTVSIGGTTCTPAKAKGCTEVTITFAVLAEDCTFDGPTHVMA